tara:strand:+ start:43836 stop:44345 length:510 start_codon:yes stop_codon:yes gene_type:complete
MDITGVNTKDIDPRLIIESGKNVYMVKGKIEGTECKFDVPVLETLEQGKTGKVYCEVIIQNEQYSKLWEDNFETISKIEVKVLESNFQEEEIKAVKPIVNLTSLIVEEIEEDEDIEEDDELEEINNDPVHKTSENEEKDFSEKIYKESKEPKEEVFSFDVFIKNKKKSK